MPRISLSIAHNKDRENSFDIPESQKLCSKLSDYFVNKLLTIRQTILDQHAHINPNISTVVLRSPPSWLKLFYLVTVSETLKLIQNCPLKTSPLDFIPTALLKACGDIFAPLVCKLANLLFTKDIFPGNFKIGQITPSFKKPGADTKDPVNYWLISISIPSAKLSNVWQLINNDKNIFLCR